MKVSKHTIELIEREIWELEYDIYRYKNEKNRWFIKMLGGFTNEHKYRMNYVIPKKLEALQKDLEIIRRSNG